LRRQWSVISDTKIRRRQKIAADNLIFGCIIGGNCLLPPKIARTENVPLQENLWSLRYFMSVFVPSSLKFFQTHLALWVCAAMHLYLTTTFPFSQLHHKINFIISIQPGTPSNWSKCQMYNNNENWSYFVSDILIYFNREII
jgi:hypothetical protein